VALAAWLSLVADDTLVCEASTEAEELMSEVASGVWEVTSDKVAETVSELTVCEASTD